ncbi:MAG TPA: hypothetical protein VHA73_01565 [Acidimicrobiales bacterium]|jgi:hypothetical protein|nr:hypothetical protein [Acidimicrobiales bacterium]
MVLAGVIWTFWIAAAVAILVILTLVALAAGYAVKAVSLKYPPGEIQRRVQDALRRR